MKMCLETLEMEWKQFGKEFPNQFCKFIIPNIRRMMHREIILKAFEKVNKKLLKESGIKPSTFKCSERLSAIISNTCEIPYGGKSLGKAFKAALKNDIVEIKQPLVVNSLCEYVGYSNYEDYILKNSSNIEDGENEEKEKITYHSKSDNGKSEITINTKNKRWFTWFSSASASSKITLIIVIAVLIITITTFSIYKGQSRWMIWQNGEYIETSFDAKKLTDGELKVYKINRINFFKQVFPDSTYTFFKLNGSVNLWYGKNINGELEFFTDIGLHPETGKTLKPITQYMIDKYL